MKRMIIVLFLALAVALFLGTTTFAQHGHGTGLSMSHSSSNHATTSANGGRQSMTQKLTDNTKLADKISKLTGMSATSACQGFKNLGQCVAAAHVAKNLNIPGGFDALKAKVTGTGSVSLGKAIESLAPSANPKSEVKKANKQASDDMKDAETNS